MEEGEESEGGIDVQSNRSDELWRVAPACARPYVIRRPTLPRTTYGKAWLPLAIVRGLLLNRFSSRMQLVVRVSLSDLGWISSPPLPQQRSALRDLASSRWGPSREALGEEAARVSPPIPSVDTGCTEPVTHMHENKVQLPQRAGLWLGCIASYALLLLHYTARLCKNSGIAPR